MFFCYIIKASTIANSATASAKAIKIIAVDISFPCISGCLAIDSTVDPPTKPTAIPAPIAASPAPIAANGP